MKILIAEDDPVSRRVLQATLNSFDYEVVAAADGTAAWPHFRLRTLPPSPSLIG